MGLAVEPPDPPDLTNRSLPSEIDPTAVVDSTVDLRRAELEEILRDGAWSEAFREWAEYTDLTEAEYRTLREAGLVERLDFYWDPIDGGVRFEAPDLSAEMDREDDLGTRAASELTDLGRTVVELIEDAYVDWDEEAAGAANWSEGSYGDETSLEE